MWKFSMLPAKPLPFIVCLRSFHAKLIGRSDLKELQAAVKDVSSYS